jgi:sulfotransferase
MSVPERGSFPVITRALRPMQRKIHFISGLPRSGSTLLAAILRQNPSFHATMSTPLCELVGALLQRMSLSDTALFVSDAQRSRILRGAVAAYYDDLPPERVAFDTNRGWCGVTSVVAQLFPDSRVVCCVRSPSWTRDSPERMPLLAPDFLLVRMERPTTDSQ